MTFNQWRQSHPEARVTEYGEFREVQLPAGKVYSADLLFNLEDYRVYDLEGGIVYLIPREYRAPSVAMTLDELFPIDPRD